LEEDNEGFGLDLYNSKIEDPQATNALRSYIVEDLKKIQKVKILLKKIFLIV